MYVVISECFTINQKCRIYTYMTKYIENKTHVPGFRPFITDEGQEILRFEDLPRDVSFKETYRLSRQEIPPHHHPWGQLLYAWEGVMQVMAEGGIWITPPQRAVWIPPGVDHSIKAFKAVRLRNIYLSPEVMNGLPNHCQVVQVTPLLREMIAEVITYPPLYDVEGAQGRMVQVLLDCLKAAPFSPLHLPVPEQGALKAIADHLKQHPDDETTLDDWAAHLGTTSRTLARQFKKQTDMTFGQWRQQARLLEALTRLADHQPIATIAQDLGYSSQSAFSAMFKKALGVTPGMYFRDGR